VAQAVAASCAIPGYYCPEVIEGRTFIDGGLHSMSNLDLLLGLKLDLVIVVSPLSTRVKFRGWDPLNRFSDATRRAVARQLDEEIAQLEAEGTQVLLLEPVADDLAAIGGNVMDDRRRPKVVQTALRTTLQQLRRPELRPLVELLKGPLAPAAAAPVSNLRPAPSKARLREAV
jgi:NTE family protein